MNSSPQSDSNRKRIRELDSEIFEVAQKNAKKAINLINEQLKLFEIEKITSQN